MTETYLGKFVCRQMSELADDIICEVHENYETESPIERLLLAAFLCRGLKDEPPEDKYEISNVDMGTFVESGRHKNYRDGCLLVFPQQKFGDYRLDFLVYSRSYQGTEVMAAVECDGHDYHERTKEQARRDKARDRFLTGEGLVVIRFTGSEIYRDPSECVHEIDRILWTQHRAKRGAA